MSMLNATKRLVANLLQLTEKQTTLSFKDCANILSVLKESWSLFGVQRVY